MCHVTGDPTPTVSWLRHDSQVETAEDAVLVAEDGGLLMINNVTLDYDGWYECEANNGVGPAQRQAVYVDVLGTCTQSQRHNKCR